MDSTEITLVLEYVQICSKLARLVNVDKNSALTINFREMQKRRSEIEVELDLSDEEIIKIGKDLILKSI